MKICLPCLIKCYGTAKCLRSINARHKWIWLLIEISRSLYCILSHVFFQKFWLLLTFCAISILSYLSLVIMSKLTQWSVPFQPEMLQIEEEEITNDLLLLEEKKNELVLIQWLKSCKLHRFLQYLYSYICHGFYGTSFVLNSQLIVVNIHGVQCVIFWAVFLFYSLMQIGFKKELFAPQTITVCLGHEAASRKVLFPLWTFLCIVALNFC